MTYQHLLVPTDGTDLSGKAVDQAIDLARTLGARLRILHVESNFPVSLVGVGELVDATAIEALMEASRAQSERILREARERAEAGGVPVETVKRVSAQPSATIVEEAKSRGCDLIVMASHGRRGLEGLLLGSETQRVLTQSPCPVLVVR